MGVIPLLDERSGPSTAASTTSLTSLTSVTSGLIPRALREISTAAAKSVYLAPGRRSDSDLGNGAGPGSGILPRYLGIFVRADDEKTEDECHPQPNVNLCEKPTAASRIDVIVPVCIAAVILIGLFITLFYFHLRRKRRDEQEWSKNNHHEMEDYGFEVPERPGNAHHR